MILTLRIPKNGEYLVSVGQQVSYGSPIMEKKSTKDIKINLSQMLGIPKKNFFHHLKKFIGEEVKKGELLADNKTFMAHKQYLSEYDGKIKEINHQEGFILLEVVDDKKQTVFAFFKGEIAGLTDEKIELSVNNFKGFPLMEASENFGGEVFYYHDQQPHTITEDHVIHKVAIAPELPDHELVKLETLGVKGFIFMDGRQTEVSTPKAKLKELAHWAEIHNLHFPSCIIDKNNNTIYFYS